MESLFSEYNRRHRNTTKHNDCHTYDDEDDESMSSYTKKKKQKKRSNTSLASNWMDRLENLAHGMYKSCSANMMDMFDIPSPSSSPRHHSHHRRRHKKVSSSYDNDNHTVTTNTTQSTNSYNNNNNNTNKNNTHHHHTRRKKVETRNRTKGSRIAPPAAVLCGGGGEDITEYAEISVFPKDVDEVSALSAGTLEEMAMVRKERFRLFQLQELHEEEPPEEQHASIPMGRFASDPTTPQNTGANNIVTTQIPGNTTNFVWNIENMNPKSTTNNSSQGCSFATSSNTTEFTSVWKRGCTTEPSSPALVKKTTTTTTAVDTPLSRKLKRHVKAIELSYPTTAVTTTTNTSLLDDGRSILPHEQEI